jgi:hypothetical protein
MRAAESFEEDQADRVSVREELIAPRARQFGDEAPWHLGQPSVSALLVRTEASKSNKKSNKSKSVQENRGDQRGLVITSPFQ